MLSTELNDLLCRVGPGTPMGGMMREYWWPVLRSERLEADGDPVRVRLLGEDWVAFRASDGRVGVIDERCPHRAVSMTLARNEDCTLRCILHGWKISVDGKVVETPNEKPDPARMARLKVRHLPVQEAAGMIWVWAGDQSKTPPAFPNYAFNAAFEASVMFGYYDCNWMQLLETLWDPTHVQLLHGEVFEAGIAEMMGEEATSSAKKAIRNVETYVYGMEARDEPTGFSYRFTSGRTEPMSDADWTPTVMPSWLFISGGEDRTVIGHVPVDDNHTILIMIAYNMTAPIGPYGKLTQIGVTDFDNFVPATHTHANNWAQDREAMRKGSNTGLGLGQGQFGAGILLQDKAALESMGGINDRTYEQVGPADHAVLKGRTYYLEAVRAYMAGQPAPGVNQDLSRDMETLQTLASPIEAARPNIREPVG